MADDKQNKKAVQTETPNPAEKRTDTKEAVVAAHDQAEADIEADMELTDIAGPLEDLDEEESIQQSGDKSDIV